MSKIDSDILEENPSIDSLVNFLKETNNENWYSRSLSLIPIFVSALKNNELQFYYQPKFSLLEPNFGEVTSFEGLLRWNKGKTMIPIMNYIKLIEDTGFIVPLGDHLITTALQDISKWREDHGKTVNCSLNLQIKQLLPALREYWFKGHSRILPPNLDLSKYDNNFQDYVLDISRKYGFDDVPITFELVERVNTFFELIPNFNFSEDDFKDCMAEFSERKIPLYLDDFLVGENTEKRLNTSKFKGIKTDFSDLNQTIIDGKINKNKLDFWNYCGKLKRKYSLDVVISEGVETIDQVAFLKSQGFVNLAQGFILSGAVPSYDVPNFLDREYNLSILRKKAAVELNLGNVRTKAGEQLAARLLKL